MSRSSPFRRVGLPFLTGFAITAPGASLALAAPALLSPALLGLMAGGLLAFALGAVALLMARTRQRAALEREVVALRQEAAALRHSAATEHQGRERFLAMVSHEIRTPMNGVQGMTELLLETPLTGEQAAYAGAVRTSAAALMRFVEDVLDQARLRQGRLVLAPRPVALAPLIEEIAELLATAAHQKNIDIATFVDRALPAEIVADAARLRQVLLNIAGNAVKFTETGGVSIVAALTDDGQLAIAIADSGIGIPEDARERIFGAFVQASAPRFDGVGLGLSISRQIVAAMGGRIELESAVGAGSTFRILLPLQAAAPPAPGPMLNGLRVLVALRHGPHGALLARAIAARGGQAVLAASQAEAAQSLRGARFDAVVADAEPGEWTEAALASVPRRIALLTPSRRGAWSALRAAGFNAYLVKPVRAVSLVAQLGETVVPAPALVPPLPAPGFASSSAGLKILVAEDNEINARLASALLNKLGHRATVVPDGLAAVAAVAEACAQQAPFDLVLMDMHMPQLDGLEAARRIHAADRAAQRAPLPIVALTAHVTAEEREACTRAGLGFLEKPLQRAALEQALAAQALAPSAA